MSDEEKIKDLKEQVNYYSIAYDNLYKSHVSVNELLSNYSNIIYSLQKEKAELTTQNTSLELRLMNVTTANAKIVLENDSLKDTNQKLRVNLINEHSFNKEHEENLMKENEQLKRDLSSISEMVFILENKNNSYQTIEIKDAKYPERNGSYILLKQK